MNILKLKRIELINVYIKNKISIILIKNTKS